MQDESNQPTVKLIFYDFKLEWQKLIEEEFTCDIILGALEAIDSLEKPESYMLRSKRPKKRLRKSNSWPKIHPLKYKQNKRLSTCTQRDPSTHGLHARMTSSNLRAIKSDKPSLISTMAEESLVKIFVKQKNPKNRTGEREIRIKFSELDAGINLQTWVMLLDFFTPSSAPLSTCDLERTRSTDTSSVKSDGMTHQARSIRRQAIENQAKPVDINIEFTVDRFSILFKKPEYKFAKAAIENFEMRLIMWEKTHRYSGSLQKLTFFDLSPCGMNYQERFVTMDKEALNFEIFRYTKVDPECLRPVLHRHTYHWIL